jgi:hypothetical protein
MDIRQRGGSRYLKAVDYPEPQTLTIRDVREESVGREEELKIVLAFDETPKLLVLNKSNSLALEDLFGWESDDWVGNKIEIYTDPSVTFQGRRTPGLRLRAPQKVFLKDIKRG